MYSNQTILKIPGDFAFKGSRVQYRLKVYYDEIESYSLIDKYGINTIDDKKTLYLSMASFMNIQIQFKCKNNVIKRIAVKKYNAWQIQKILDEIEKRSGVKCSKTYAQFRKDNYS